MATYRVRDGLVVDELIVARQCGGRLGRLLQLDLDRLHAARPLPANTPRRNPTTSVHALSDSAA